MMSFFDILASLALAISRLAMPSDIGVRGAVGNSFTCTAQGICVWLGFAVPFQNSSLNLFYLLSTNYSMKNDDFSKKIEPFLHLISISIPVSFAIIFTVRGEIAPSGNACFGNSKECSRVMEETETRKQALLYTLVFVLTFIFPIIRAVIFIINSNKNIVLVVLTGILHPLQEFWYFVLYIRPGVNIIVKETQI